MTPEVLGILLILTMLFAIFIGFPISFTLIFLGVFFGYLGFGDLVFYLMTFQFSGSMLEQTLAAIPLFTFMGILMEKANLMERLWVLQPTTSKIQHGPPMVTVTSKISSLNQLLAELDQAGL